MIDLANPASRQRGVPIILQRNHGYATMADATLLIANHHDDLTPFTAAPTGEPKATVGPTNTNHASEASTAATASHASHGESKRSAQRDVLTRIRERARTSQRKPAPQKSRSRT